MDDRPTQRQVVVYDDNDVWTCAFRRQLSPEIPVVGSPSLTAGVVDQILRPGWVSILPAVADDAQAACAQLSWILDRQPRAVVIAVVPPFFHELAWRLRAGGVIHVLSAAWEVPAACRLVRRRWLQRPTPPALSFEQRIWNNLPWPEAGLPTQGNPDVEQTDGRSASEGGT
jgi:hypothetical protein